MTRNNVSTLCGLLMLCLCAGAASQAQPPLVLDTTYPQYRLTPANPTIQDSVSLWFVKGMSSACVPIAYSTSFTTSDDQIVCIKAPCPAGYTIKILYRQLLVGIVCLPPLPPPAEYGPHFAFGKLAAGYYTVKDSTDSSKTLFEFSVGQNASIRSQVSLSRSASGISQIAYFGGSLHFTLDRPQRLSISAYTLGGRKIAALSRAQDYSPGINSLAIGNRVPAEGVVLLRIEGQGFAKFARIEIE
jgi:hypothetical protein